MADLLTHLASVYVPTRLGVRDPAVRSLAYLGVCLPDVLSRTGLDIQVRGGLTVHDIVHTPAFLALAAFAASQLFASGLRKSAFLALWMGGLFHLCLDGGKGFQEGIGVLWGFPWSLKRWAWGFYLPEETVYFMAPALLVLVLARTLGRKKEDRSLRSPAAEESPIG